ncbi:MAG: ABC transporter permease [Microbacterium sp.]
MIVLLSLLALVIVVTSIQSPAFLSLNNVTNIGLQVARIGLMACGMTFVMIAGGIDLSVGSVLALGAAVVGVLLAVGIPAVLAVTLAILSGALAGLVNGAGVAYFRIPPLILTLGMLYAIRGGILLASSGSVSGSTIATGFSEDFLTIGQGELLGIPTPVWVVLLGFVVAHVVLRRMRFGRYTIAVGTDASVSRRAGISVNGHLLRVYAMCGALAALTGVIVTSQVGAASTDVGLGDELTVIAAVVIGGTALTGGIGSIVGTFVGVVFLSVAQNALDILNVSPFAFQLAVGVLLLVSSAADILTNRPGWLPQRRRGASTAARAEAAS